MKIVSRIGLALLLATVNYVQAYEVKEVTGDDIPKLMEKGYILVNALSERLYNDCKIPNSINVPGLDSVSDFEAVAKEKLAGKNVIMYCAGTFCPVGRTTSAALHLMNFRANLAKQKPPFGDIVYFPGGITGWRAEGKQAEGPCKEDYLSIPVEKKSRSWWQSLLSWFK